MSGLAVVHIKREPYTRYIGRGSDLGNPFTHKALSQTKAYMQVPTLADSVGCFELWARGNTAWDYVIPPAVRLRLLTALKMLGDEDILGCFCRPYHECHGDVIAKLYSEYRAGTFLIS